MQPGFKSEDGHWYKDASDAINADTMFRLSPLLSKGRIQKLMGILSAVSENSSQFVKIVEGHFNDLEKHADTNTNDKVIRSKKQLKEKDYVAAIMLTTNKSGNGSFTIKELSKVTNRHEVTICTTLQKMVRKGIVEMLPSEGMQNHYVLKEGKQKNKEA